MPVNNFIKIMTLIIFLTSACQNKTTEESSAVDLAKVEQLKKLLAEQSSAVANAIAPNVSTVTSEDPNRLVNIRTYPNSINLLEGMSATFSVIAQQVNGVDKSLSTGVTFGVAPAGIIDLNPTALNSLYSLKALSPGTVTITMVSGTLTTTLAVVVKAKEIVSVEIFPKSVAVGTPTRFTLLAVYNNGTQSNLSSGVTWESINPIFLQANTQSRASGVFTGARVGLSGLRAIYGSTTVIARIDIQMPRILKIDVSAETDTYLLGTSDIQVSAVATFIGGNTFDIASSVNWSVDDSSIVSISSLGIMEALFPGEVKVTATYGTYSGNTSFFITSETFDHFRISPATATTPVGIAASYKFYGVRADNTERDISTYSRWTVDDISTASSGTSLSPKQPGKIYGVAKGTTTVHARYGMNTLATTVVVSDPIVLGITMTGSNLEGVCGVDDPKFHVDGQMSDGTTKDMTALVTYNVDPISLGIPYTDPTKAGAIKTLAAGTGTVTAAFLEPATNVILSASKLITAKPPIQLNIGITSPLGLSVPYGTQVFLTSGQLMSCGTGADYTTTSVWQTDNSSSVLNTLINSTANKGTLSTIDMGIEPKTSNATIKVTATKGTLTNDLTITVRPKEITRVTVNLADPVTGNPDLTTSGVDINTTIQLLASALFSNGETVVLPDSVDYPNYAVQYSLVDCGAGGGCATIDPATGIITALGKEGYISVYATITPPLPVLPIQSLPTTMSIRSKCEVALGGVRTGLYCMRKGTLGASCTQTCYAVVKGGIHGTYHTATLTVFGSGGSSYSACDSALLAVGYTAGIEFKLKNDSSGVGCSIYKSVVNDTKSEWENSTPTTAGDIGTGSSTGRYFRICACTEPP